MEGSLLAGTCFQTVREMSEAASDGRGDEVQCKFSGWSRGDMPHQGSKVIINKRCGEWFYGMNNDNASMERKILATYMFTLYKFKVARNFIRSVFYLLEILRPWNGVLALCS